jgi:hypothetical protein
MKIETPSGTDNYATQNNGKTTTVTDRLGNQYTANQGANGQIDLVPHDKNVQPISGQVTGSGESAAFGNKNTSSQTESSEQRTSSKSDTQTTAHGGSSTAASKADTSKESFTSAQNQAESSIQSSTRSNQQSGSSEAGDYKSKSSGSAGSDSSASSSGKYSNDSSGTTNHGISSGQGITDGGTGNSPAKQFSQSGDSTGGNNNLGSLRNEQANISATASGAQQRIDNATKTGSLDGQSANASSTGNRIPDAAPQSTVIPDKNTPGSGAGGDKGATNQGGSDIGRGVKTTDTPQATPSATPGKGTGADNLGNKGPGNDSGKGTGTGDPNAGKGPGDNTNKGQGPSDNTNKGQGPGDNTNKGQGPSDNTNKGQGPGDNTNKGQGLGDNTNKGQGPGDNTGKGPASDGAATKGTGADGAAIKGSGTDGAAAKGSGADAPATQGSKQGDRPGEGSGGSNLAGKSETGGDKPQSADKGQASGEKSSMPPVDVSQKETRKDLLDTMKAIDSNKLENLPAKDQKFVDSLEAMKKNEPDKYNQLKELLGKDAAAQGGLGKGDQAAYLGKLNTLLSLEKSGTSGLPDGAAMLRGFLNNNKEMLLGTAGNDAQQKAAMVTLAAMIQAMNKTNAAIGIPGQTPLQAQDVLAALQNQAKGQPGALDQLLASTLASGKDTSAAAAGAAARGDASAAATAAATAAGRAGTDATAGGQGLGGVRGPGQLDAAAFSPTGPGIGKPGDATDGTAASDSKNPLGTNLGGKEDLTGKVLKPDATAKTGDPSATKPGANQGSLTQKGPQAGKPLDPNAPQDGVKPLHPGGPQGGSQGGSQFDPMGDGTLLGDKDKKEKDEAEEKQEEDKNKPDPEQRQKYIVQFGDTLESIGAKKLGSSNLAPLIYEINSKVITSWMKNGKRVIDLKPKLVIYLPTTADIEEYNSRPLNSGQEFEYAGNAYKTPEEELAMWESQIRGQMDGLRSEIVNKLGLHPHSAGSAIAGDLSNLGEQGAEAAAAFKIRNPNVEKLLGPLKSSQSGDAGRSKYTVRLGDTLRSIALKHPLLQDVKLWKVLALANDLPTTTDNKGVPTTVIKRGMTLLIPTQEEIEEFRKSLGIGSNKTVQSAKPTSNPSTFDIVTKPCPECESIVRDSDTICPKCGHSFAAIPADAPTLTREPKAKKGAKIEPVSDSSPTLTKIPGDTTGGDKRKVKGMRAVRAKALAAGSDPETFVPPGAAGRGKALAADSDTETIAPPGKASIDRAKSISESPDRRLAASAQESDADTVAKPDAATPRKKDLVPRVDASPWLSPIETSMQSTARQEDDEDPTTTILRAAGMLPTGEKKPLPPTLFEIKPSRPEKQDPGSAPTLFDVVPPLRSKANRRGSDSEPASPDTSEAASANAFIKQMSESCRLVKSNEELYGLKEGDKLCLEVNHESHWIPVVIYEITDDASKRHEFRLDGKRRTTRIDLPPFAVRELADNDLASNWENYYSRYMAGKNLSD